LLSQICERIGQVEESFGCWPENWLSFRVFYEATAGGAYVQVRYETLPHIYEAFGIKKKKRAEIFRLLRILENEALNVINER
jgi:hypothetical protein